MFESCLGAECRPPSPDAVELLVGIFLLRIQDDSMVCRARMVKEEISVGRGEMAKPSGINCGMNEWKRWVRVSSEAESGARGARIRGRNRRS